MDLQKIKVGLTNEVSEVVTAEMTAAVVGSGLLEVYATPRMIALMEKASADLLERCTPAEITTVGIALNVEHKAATPVGMKVRAVAEIIAVEGRKISFTVKSYDEKEEIGSGTHERFAVDSAKFFAKAKSKAEA